MIHHHSLDLSTSLKFPAENNIRVLRGPQNEDRVWLEEDLLIFEKENCSPFEKERVLLWEEPGGCQGKTTTKTCSLPG